MTTADTSPQALLTPSQLREWIYAGDRSRVSAALTALPTATRAEQNRQRALFSVFSELHPQVIAFADDWAKAEPETPEALAARGWSLHSQGWAFRGNGYAHEVYPQAMEYFHSAHAEGLSLMQKAVTLKPTLLAASDGILKMSYTVGQSDLIAPEVARIMEVLPNRGSLTISALGHAPSWGGSVKMMEMICRTYAEKVTAIPGYDAETCLVDGLLESGTMNLQEVQDAYPKTANRQNPLFAERLDQDADIQGETAAEKLAHLDKLKETRPLTYLEANIYDQNIELVASMTGETREREFPAAVARQAEEARDMADRNPGDFKAVSRLRYAQEEDLEVNGTKVNWQDLVQRTKASLAINPFSPAAWALLGEDRLFQPDGGEVAAVLAAEPYLINATVYSNYKSRHLKMLAGVKLGLFFRSLNGGVRPSDQQVWQDGIECPMVRQLRLLVAVCEAEGKDFQTCSGLQQDTAAIDNLITEISSVGLCETEAESPLEKLTYGPAMVDLTLD